ncbi:MAG TPA: amidohydrolase family protein [Bacteroidia bacterium]|jgi:cytosine/adenosine deaminase-related metal-dependent hydrolase
MRKISADHIYTLTSAPLKNGVITLDDDGTIIDIEHAGEPDIKTEFYSGIICPGFINTHCHLELSHMKGRIPEKTGMAGFIKEILSIRPTFSDDEINQGIVDAEAEMISNGIVAIGDISNDNSTFAQKAKGNIRYQTFLEVFDLDPSKAPSIFSRALELKRQLAGLETENIKLPASIVPHAPYTVTDQLFGLIAEQAKHGNSIISIHNQESIAESQLFEEHSGPLFEAFSRIGIDFQNFPVSGKNSLRTTFSKLPLSQKILLVHNTFTSADDIEWAEKMLNAHNNRGLYWCTCPKANLYIEGKLPDYKVFVETKAKMTIGTDSLASNTSLSVLDEIKTIAEHFPGISLQSLLTWACKNGAEFLGTRELGTIEKGKKPGLNLLTNTGDQEIGKDTGVIRLI